MNRRHAAALLAGAPFAAACRKQKASRVRLIVYTGAETPYVAQSLGHFTQQGLEVEIQELAGAAKAMEALLGGSADVILGTLDQTLQVNAQGKSVQAFRLLSECHCLGLVVSPAASKPIRTLADLKGATVGVAAPGGPMQNFLRFLLKRNQIDPDQVNVASVGIGPSALTALERGRVDAAVVFHGTKEQLDRRGAAAPVLAETFTHEGAQKVFGQESFPSTSLIADRSWLQAGPDRAKRIVNAFHETVAWMKSQPVEEVRKRLPEQGRSPDPEIDRATLGVLIPSLSSTGRIAARQARLAWDVLVSARPEILAKPPRIETCFTNEYLPVR
jgi:NitT/TauT family transport system substrate-binding protein